MESSSVTGENPFQIPANILTNPGTRLEAQIRAVRGLPDEKFASELKAASQEFEAVFIAYLLKVMRDTIEESGLMDGGFGKSIYTELFDQEVSLTIARRGMLGMSDLLYQNLLSGTSMDKIGEPPTESSRDPAFESQGPAYSGIEKPKQLGDYGSEIPDIQLPVQGPVSSAFGPREDPFSRQLKFHKGIDIAAFEGMKVIAALPGRVVYAGYEKGYGKTVLVQHTRGIQTRYGHLGAINVKEGDFISSGGVLGVVGTTGRSTGPHLHFEVMRSGRHVDPLSQLKSKYAGITMHRNNSATGAIETDVFHND